MSWRHLAAPLVLAEEPVQPTLLSHKADEDDDGDEGEGGARLPHLHPGGGGGHQDDQQPDVGEDREEHGHDEHGEGLDPPRLALGDHEHAVQ